MGPVEQAGHVRVILFPIKTVFSPFAFFVLSFPPFSAFA